MRRLTYVSIVFAVTTCVAFAQTPDGEGNLVTPDSRVVDRQLVYDIGITEATAEEPAPKVAPEGKAEKLVVVSATWCIPCRTYAVVCKELKAEGYDVEYIYVDTKVGEEKLAKYSNIKLGKSDKINYYSAYPTSFFIRDGVIIKKLEGVKSRKTVLDTLWKDEEAKNVIDKIRDRLPWNN